jgi:hypothetical protein
MTNFLGRAALSPYCSIFLSVQYILNSKEIEMKGRFLGRSNEDLAEGNVYSASLILVFLC